MKIPVKRHEVVQPLDQPYRLIPLTQGQNAIVDVEDFEWVNQWNWHAHWSRSTKSFYVGRKSCRKRIFLHREILGCSEKEEVDHINHDSLDNRRKNLRACTHAQNIHNALKRSDNKSGYRGVSWSNSQKAWQARIKINRRYNYLGRFASAKEAALAYDAACKIYHGEFGRCNFE